MRLLLEHGFAFYLADRTHGLLLFGWGQRVDVVEDVGAFGYADGCSVVSGLEGILGVLMRWAWIMLPHLAEHVGLGLAAKPRQHIILHDRLEQTMAS